MPDCPQASKTDKWKLLLATLASLAVLYLVLAPFNQPLYNLLLFPIPDPRIPSVQDELDRLRASGIESRFVEFRSANGRKIRGLFTRVPNAHRVFLYSHAKGNNLFGKLHVAENLLTCGGSVLSYDYQGYGQSEGKASIAGSCDDAVAAYDYLRNSEHYKAKDIIAYGESFGSGVTGQLIQRRKPGAVIFHSAFASLRSAGRDTLPWLRLYPDWAFTGPLLDNVTAFQKPHPPLLLIHGDKDAITSFRNSQQIFQTAIEPKELYVVHHGGHCSFGAGDEVIVAVRSFLSKFNP